MASVFALDHKVSEFKTLLSLYLLCWLIQHIFRLSWTSLCCWYMPSTVLRLQWDTAVNSTRVPILASCSHLCFDFRLAGEQSLMTGSRLTQDLSMTQMPIPDTRSQLKPTFSLPIPQFQVSGPLPANQTVHPTFEMESWSCVSFPLLQ